MYLALHVNPAHKKPELLSLLNIDDGSVYILNILPLFFNLSVASSFLVSNINIPINLLL